MASITDIDSPIGSTASPATATAEAPDFIPAAKSQAAASPAAPDFIPAAPRNLGAPDFIPRGVTPPPQFPAPSMTPKVASVTAPLPPTGAPPMTIPSGPIGAPPSVGTGLDPNGSFASNVGENLLAAGAVAGMPVVKGAMGLAKAQVETMPFLPQPARDAASAGVNSAIDLANQAEAEQRAKLSPVQEAIAPHVAPLAAMAIPGAGPYVAGAMEGGKTYAETGNPTQAALQGGITAATAALPVGKLAQGVAKPLEPIIGKTAAAVAGHVIAPSAVGATSSVASQVAEGKPIDWKQVAASGGLFAAFHGLFQAAEAADRQMAGQPAPTQGTGSAGQSQGDRFRQSVRDGWQAGHEAAGVNPEAAARAELGIPDKWDLRPEDIDGFYRNRVKQTHPDAGGSDEAFARTKAAREYLRSIYGDSVYEQAAAKSRQSPPSAQATTTTPPPTPEPRQPAPSNKPAPEFIPAKSGSAPVEAPALAAPEKAPEPPTLPQAPAVAPHTPRAAGPPGETQSPHPDAKLRDALQKAVDALSERMGENPRPTQNPQDLADAMQQSGATAHDVTGTGRTNAPAPQQGTAAAENAMAPAVPASQRNRETHPGVAPAGETLEPAKAAGPGSETLAPKPVAPEFIPAKSQPARDYGTLDAPNRINLGQHFGEQLSQGKSYPTINDARAEASKLLGGDVQPGTLAAKHVDEAMELGVVHAARNIVASGKDPHEIFDRLVDLYNRQPNLGVRTSTSVAQQAYSTPAPLAYVASQLAGITPDTTVHEPTAGNGMLLIGANPEKTYANELNPQRADALKDQGFAVTQKDAAAPNYFPIGKPDVVIANPPFGAVREGDGAGNLRRKEWTIDGVKTGEVDHAIALNALHNLPQNGRAVLILGAKGADAANDLDRRKAYLASGAVGFYKHLYQNYNVTQHFTVGGDLYKRQGAGFPVDVIVIDGKGRQATRKTPWAQAPEVYNTWKELGHVLDTAKQQPASNPGSAAPAPDVHDVETGVVPAAGNEPAGDRGAAVPGESGNDVGSVPVESARAGEVADTRTRPAGGREEAGGKPVVAVHGETVPLEQQQSRSGGATDIQSGRGGTAESLPQSEPADLADQTRPHSAGDDRAEGNESGKLAESSPAAKRAVTPEAETEFQVAYKPSSAEQGLGTLTPKNMASATDTALADVVAEHGPVDQFVAKELGDPKLAEHFGAEQIDALAMAIHNFKKGAGFVLGDQTGVGKGRVVAGMMRFAKKQGLLPIFVTKSPNLYADIMRDLADIGMSPKDKPFNPLVTNDLSAKEDRLPLPDGRVLSTTGDHKSVVMNAVKNYLDGKGLSAAVKGQQQNFDALFTTYSQLQTVAGNATWRNTALSQLQRRGFFVLDESHEAGGTRQTGWRAKDQPLVGGRAGFVRQLIADAPGVMYSSATYAKRPEVMDLYGRTDMGLAVDGKLDELPDAIAKGGVPLQQAVANMLAESGQYARRERSFKGVDFKPETVDVGLDRADKVSSIFRAIRDFDDIKEAVVGKMDDEVTAEGGRQVTDTATGKAGVSSTSFSSIMHNLVDQMLLSLKVDKLAEGAIAAHARGERPVLVLDNTMESALKRHMQEEKLRAGDSVTMNFKDLLHHYLERSREVLIRDSDGNTTRRRLKDEELGQAGMAAYKAAEALIKNSGLDLPSSPIDRALQLLEAKGLKVGEITGREWRLKYAQDGSAKLAQRPADEASPAGRVRAVKAFNNGDVDALILNRAGSTGLSLHAHPSFGNTNRRHMIIGQPAKNIDDFMQMLGRVHRTGQVVPPAYTLLMSNAPAENRPASVLVKKLASLNASVTAAHKGAVGFDVPDIMNQVGDQVVSEYMDENTDLHQMLGEPLGRDDSGALADENAAARVSGRASLLPVADQKRFWDDVVDRYNAKIAELDAIGENPLVAKTLDLDAKTQRTMLLFDGKEGSDSPFAGPAKLEEIDMKMVGKPYPSAKVGELLRDELKVESDSQVPAAGKAWSQKTIADLEQKTQDYLDDRLARTENPDGARRIENDVNRGKNAVMGLMDRLPPGTPITVTTPSGNDLSGVVLKFHQRGNPKNPTAAGSWLVRVAVADAARQLDIPVSATAEFKGQDKSYHLAPTFERLADALPSFDHAASKSRETRYMATGNLLAAYAKIENGQIVHYTARDGGIKQGILLPKNFDLKEYLDKAPIPFEKPAQALSFMQQGYALETNDQNLSVAIGYGNGQSPAMEIVTSKSKARGGQYFLNDKLRRVLAPLEFVSAGNKMKVRVQDPAQKEKVLRVLMNEFGLFAHKDKEAARQAAGLPSLDEQAGRMKGEPQVSSGSRGGGVRGQRHGGYVSLPNADDAKYLLGNIRHLRERFSPIEAQDGATVANAFIRVVQAGVEAETLVNNFIRKAFGDDKKLLADFRNLGWYYRGEDLNNRGLPASGIPTMPYAQKLAIESNPKIQAAIKLWNREIAPKIEDIRTSRGMIMSQSLKAFPFILNLPGEHSPASSGRRGVNMTDAFNEPATGEGAYQLDPRETLLSVVRGHLSVDAKRNLADEIRQLSINPATVVDPLGQRNPALFHPPVKGQYFKAPYNGRVEPVAVVDISDDPTKPEYHYVPVRVANQFNNIYQVHGQYDQIVDKALRTFTRGALIGDFAPHTLRVLARVGARLAQAGYTPASSLPSWLGSTWATIRRMRQMVKSPIGEAIQLLIDRAGANRGEGYGIKQATTSIGAMINLPHNALMDADVGIDPMGRRVVADAHLRMELGNDFMDKVEKDLASGKITPMEAADGIARMIGSKGVISLGRRVNATMGFSNRQTRSELLNWMQRVFPFISSESGMIPDEIRQFATANLNPRGIGRAVAGGRYGQALKMLAGSLATGAAGIYMLMNGLNYASTKYHRGQGRWLWENDEGHKLDVEIAPGWYLTNLDPSFSRAARLLGVRNLANHAAMGIGREAVNEALSMLNMGVKAPVMLATGLMAYFGDGNRSMKATLGSYWPFGVARNTAQAAAEGKPLAPAAARDAVSMLTGYQLKQSSGKNYTPVERLAHELAAKESSNRELSPEEQQRHQERRELVQQLRDNPAQRGKLLVDAENKGTIARGERRQMLKEADQTALENLVQNLSAENAMKLYTHPDIKPVEKAELEDVVRDKIMRSRRLSYEQQDQMLEKAGITPPPDLAIVREYKELTGKKREADEAQRNAIMLRRQASMLQKEGNADSARGLLQQAATITKQSRLLPAEAARLDKLRDYEKMIRNTRNQMANGLLSEEQGEAKLANLVRLAGPRTTSPRNNAPDFIPARRQAVLSP